VSTVLGGRIYSTSSCQYIKIGVYSLENLPPVILWNCVWCACQIEGIVIVASSVTNVVHGIRLAGIDMVSRKSETATSELFWSFDEGSAEASFDVELDVAVEEPDAYACQ